MKAAGLPALDHVSNDFARLCRRLLVAKQEYIQIEAGKSEGNYPPPRPTTRLAQRPAQTAKATGPLLSVAAKQYFKEVPRAKRTQEQATAELEKFFNVIGGDKAIDRITVADGRTYKQNSSTQGS